MRWNFAQAVFLLSKSQQYDQTTCRRIRSIVESLTERRMVDAMLTYDRMVKAEVIPNMATKGRLLGVSLVNFFFFTCFLSLLTDPNFSCLR